MMDPEPGRCRRTDGRKWRCSKSIIPGQKYCEVHMHRGRKSSRKHVEHLEALNHSDPPELPISVSITPKTIPNSATSDNDTFITSSETRKFVLATADAPATISYMGDVFKDQSSRTRINHVKGEDIGLNGIKTRKTDIKKNHSYIDNNVMFNNKGFPFSEESVLEGDTGHAKLGLDDRVEQESVPQRCKRTDGKRWQCGYDAILNGKYCQVHMHRGAKRHAHNAKSANVRSPASPATSASNSLLMPNSDGHSSINLNTRPSSPHEVTDDCGNSSSEATTISDENVSPCRA